MSEGQAGLTASRQLKNGIRIKRRGAEDAERCGEETGEEHQKVNAGLSAKFCVSPRSRRLGVKVRPGSTVWFRLMEKVGGGGFFSVEASAPSEQTRFVATKTRVQLCQLNGRLRPGRILRAEETGS
jgi:hypothetical protein